MQPTCTCKHFDPSEALAKKLHLAPSKEYPYDDHMLYNSCWSQPRKIAYGHKPHEWIGCEYNHLQPQCQYYEAEEPRRIELIRIDMRKEKPDDPAYGFVQLTSFRTLLGVPEVECLRWFSNEPEPETIFSSSPSVESVFRVTGIAVKELTKIAQILSRVALRETAKGAKSVMLSTEESPPKANQPFLQSLLAV